MSSKDKSSHEGRNSQHKRYQSFQVDPDSSKNLSPQSNLRKLAKKKPRLPSHKNPTGPADYNLPRLFDSFGPVHQTPQGTLTSFKASMNNKQQPIYSFGTRLNSKRVVNINALQDFLGRDSPGPGSHDPINGCFSDIPLKKNLRNTQSINVTQKSNGNFRLPTMQNGMMSPNAKSFGTSQRFFQFNANNQQSFQVPCSYLDESRKFGKVQVSSVLSNLKAQMDDSQLQKQRIFESTTNQTFFGIPTGGTRGPGPGDYNTEKMTSFVDQDMKSVATSKIAAQRSKRGSMTLETDRFGVTKKVFCKEYAKDKMGNKVPGPQDYRVQQINKKGQVKHSIPAQNRNLLTVTKDDGPSPAYYNLGPSPSQVSLQTSQKQQNQHASSRDLRQLQKSGSKNGLASNASMASLRVYQSPKGGKFGTQERFSEW